MAKWKATKFPGVRYRENTQRKNGVKFDRYYAIRYRLNGRQKEEGLGWASAGWTEKKAADTLSSIRENIRTGKGPQTLSQSRAQKAEEMRRAEQIITFGDFFRDTYFPERNRNTQRREEQLFRAYIEPVIGSKKLSEISPFDLERVKKKMDHLAPRTIRYALAVVRQVFNKARDYGVFPGENPVIRVKFPSADNKRQRFLTRAEADTLLSEIGKRSLQLHDMALLSLHCGLRQGEIFSLTWDCTDLDAGTLFIRDTKSGKDRHVYMTGQVKEMFVRREVTKEKDLIFLSRKGEQIKDISKVFFRVVKEMGLNDGISDRRQKVVFHTLRHTFASWLVQDGETLYTVAKLLGHSTVAMTERYSHLAPDNLRSAMERFESNLSPSSVIPFPKAG